MVAGATVAAISAAITLFIGIWVITTVITSVDQASWSTDANSTFTKVQSITWSALKLLAVGIIVLAAGVILAYFGVGRK